MQELAMQQQQYHSDMWDRFSVIGFINLSLSHSLNRVHANKTRIYTYETHAQRNGENAHS